MTLRAAILGLLLIASSVMADEPAAFATTLLTGEPATPPPAPKPESAGPGPRSSDYPASDVTVFLGGRLQYDLVDYITTDFIRDRLSGLSPLRPGTTFRRLRIDASGALHRNIDYMLQVDFFNEIRLDNNDPRATNVVVPTDVWVHFKEVPWVGNIRLGNQKPLYSFEHLTSSRYLNFLERSLGFDAFVENFNNGFSPGVSFFDTYLDKRGFWGVGVVKNSRSIFGYNVGNGELDVNGRVTFLPVDEDEGSQLIHIGVGTSLREPDEGTVRARARLDARNSPSAISKLVADTGLLPASGQYLIIPEFAAVSGPFSMQSEYYACWVTDAEAIGNAAAGPQGTAYLSSWYIEGHVFLTGEHRAYNRNSGVFGAVKPLRPLDWTRCGFNGCGAWQLTARYSYLDLNSGPVRGGRVHDLTLGVNWFLNAYAKFQTNAFLADRQDTRDGGDGQIYGFASRLALDF